MLLHRLEMTLPSSVLILLLLHCFEIIPVPSYAAVLIHRLEIIPVLYRVALLYCYFYIALRVYLFCTGLHFFTVTSTSP